MEKIRVPKGEKYWYIASDFFAGDFYVTSGVDFYEDMQDGRFAIGNYFHTKEEAEAMACKLRAALKGADVIEMPSEKEIREKASDIAFTEEPYSENDWGELEYGISNMSDSAIKMANWLKSKILK